MTHASALVREAHEARKARHSKWARNGIHDAETGTGPTDEEKRVFVGWGGFCKPIALPEANQNKIRKAAPKPKAVPVGCIPPRPGRIITMTAKHFRIGRRELVAFGRSKSVVLPRQICMYLMDELTELSPAAIGRRFSDRHHATVRHAVIKVRRMIAEDQSLRGVVDTIARDVG